jgi:hypothetical protein
LLWNYIIGINTLPKTTSYSIVDGFTSLAERRR